MSFRPATGPLMTQTNKTRPFLRFFFSLFSYRNTVFQGTDIVWVRKLDNGQFVFFLHVLDPFVGLTWIWHQKKQMDLATNSLYGNNASCVKIMQPCKELSCWSWTSNVPWGSIISGHLRALSTTIPLSTENESTGRPAMFHARILTGLPRVAFRENDSEQGIFLTLHCSTQLDIQSWEQRTKTEVRYSFFGSDSNSGGNLCQKNASKR